MDEILLANFMVFHDLVRDEDYDLSIGDEAWDLDYFLHENPEQKHAAYVWMTDFVGWLPMPDGGEHEAFITADYNAEMIEHIARFPRLRDRSIFVGEPDDIVPDALRTRPARDSRVDRAHYDFPGYITGFDPRQRADREALGYRPDERSASSPSAAPASAATFSGASSPLSPRRSARAGAADDRRGRAADRSGLSAAQDGMEMRPTSPTSTGIWPPVTSRSFRAA